MARIPVPGGTAHLTYCQNVHAVETAGDVLAAIERWAGPVAHEAFGPGPCAAGLRLGADAAAQLGAPARRGEMADALARAGLYAPTVNAFPQGRFQQGRVKEDVFRPTWLEEPRIAYTQTVVDLLADLLPSHVEEGTVSTSPGSFKPWGDGREERDGIARNLARSAFGAMRAADRTGRPVRICLEPEPFGTVETIEEAISFFEGPLRTHAARWLARHEGIARGRAEGILQRHLGVCLDTGHQMVEHENLASGYERLRRNEIRVGKVQISNALSLPEGRRDPAAPAAARLRDRFFHQVVARGADGASLRHVDLETLPDPLPIAWRDARDWRIHYHTPLFLDRLDGIPTLQKPLGEFLARLGAVPGPLPHLEVETYTWTLLPGAPRDDDALREGLVRELLWARERLGGPPA